MEFLGWNSNIHLKENLQVERASPEEQKNIKEELSRDVGSSRDRQLELQREIENVNDQLVDAKIDKNRKLSSCSSGKSLGFMIEWSTCVSRPINTTMWPSQKCWKSAWKLSL
jgi:hypothetical protein